MNELDDLTHYMQAVSSLRNELAEKDAALAALAEALRQAWPHVEHVSACYSRQREGLDCACAVGPILSRVHIALAPDAVQRAIAAAKAKDEEIERLRERAKDHAELHLKHLETEAQLAVAMGLLEKALRSYCDVEECTPELAMYHRSPVGDEHDWPHACEEVKK